MGEGGGGILHYNHIRASTGITVEVYTHSKKSVSPLLDICLLSVFPVLLGALDMKNEYTHNHHSKKKHSNIYKQQQ